MIIIPANWAELQHYKDRSPPWIKLHRKLLDNYDFQTLPVASRALAPMLWLLASDHKTGEIDAAPHKLAFRFRMTEQELIDALNPLISMNFFSVVQGDSTMLASSKQDAIPEERRGETEKEREEKPRATRLPKDFYPNPEPEAEQGINRDFEFEKFKDYWNAKSGKDATKLDWQATWRNWARSAKRAPADVARMTVPGTDAIDPALQKLDMDKQYTKPPSPEQLAAMRALRSKVFQ